MPPKFSLLMCVCDQDNDDLFSKALKSVILDQNLPPDEVVIVLDGPVEQVKLDIIDAVLNKNNVNFHLINNEACMGLAFSLNEGLKRCSFDWVARMDADDISMPDRFSKQMCYIGENLTIAVLGSSVREFGSMIKDREKIAITNPAKIRETLKFRNPMNHPSCILNREKILSVGGYPNFKKNQDYGLWVILASKGFILDNLQDVLLDFRITEDFLSKRGRRLLQYDYSVLMLMRELRFISLTLFGLMIIARTILRISPAFILKLSYSISRRLVK